MSNERSPRGSCLTTMGTRGMTLGLLSATAQLRFWSTVARNLPVARAAGARSAPRPRTQALHVPDHDRAPWTCLPPLRSPALAPCDGHRCPSVRGVFRADALRDEPVGEVAAPRRRRVEVDVEPDQRRVGVAEERHERPHLLLGAAQPLQVADHEAARLAPGDALARVPQPGTLERPAV